MAVDSKHPEYLEYHPDWTSVRDAWRGQRQVKSKRQEYLHPTSGMVADGLEDGQPGRLAYDAYLKRAVFPDIFRSTVNAMLGVMHQKPPVIELPARLEPMRENATVKNESLEVLLRRINEEQLITGRIGLLLDVPDNAPADTSPYIAPYFAEAIFNWDDGTRQELIKQNLNLVTLDESEFERVEDFEWEFEQKTRVCILGFADVNEPEGLGVYQTAVYDDSGTTFDPSQLVVPSIGGNVLNEIPFTFINSTDIVPEVEEPPMLGLSDLAYTIYRGEADYRQSLFMQGQDTLVVTGATGSDSTEEGYRTGANSVIELPVGGTAEFIGVSSEGLSEQRTALENDKKVAATYSAQLADNSGQAESGDALRIRVGSRAATLNQVVLTGAFGLENCLKQAARWVGADENEVSVTPNQDFSFDELGGRTLVEYMTAKSMGAPFSLRSIHNLMREKDLTKMEFDEEVDAIQEETLALDQGLGQGSPIDDSEGDDEETEEQT